MAKTQNSSQAHEGGVHHVVPYSVLINVMWALLVLTVVTVITAKFVHLGAFAALVAFAIAAVKAYLVMAYFMGLKYDAASNRFIFATGFVFLAVLLLFCVLDIATRVSQTSTL
jgi:cytochrome c oxidase subunit 4